LKLTGPFDFAHWAEVLLENSITIGDNIKMKNSIIFLIILMFFIVAPNFNL